MNFYLHYFDLFSTLYVICVTPQMQNDIEQIQHFVSTNNPLATLYTSNRPLLTRILTTPTLLHTLLSLNPNILSVVPIYTLDTSHLYKFVPVYGTVLSVTNCYCCIEGVYFMNDQFYTGNATYCVREVGMSTYVNAYYFNVQMNIGRIPRSFEAYIEEDVNENRERVANRCVEPRIGTKAKMWGVYKTKWDGKMKGYPTRFKTVFHVYHMEYCSDIEEREDREEYENYKHNETIIRNSNESYNHELQSHELRSLTQIKKENQNNLQIENNLDNNNNLRDSQNSNLNNTQEIGINTLYQINPNNTILNYVLAKNAVTLDTFVPLFAPTVFGHTHIKQAIMLQLLGGSSFSSSTVRSSIHILLVGDPSVSKSMLLRFVSKTFNCVFTSGRGVSNAGLTVSIVDKKIMPGALVLSDFVCCIDEFTQLDCLYEAMEQQTLSINKAGVNLSIRIKCGILAASNESDVEEALQTRFDLVFNIQDTQKYDTEIVTQVMRNHTSDMKEDDDTQFVCKRNINYLTDYIRHCRNIEPRLSRPAQQLIIKHYLNLRKVKCVFKVTPRCLESLIRLASAHAKLRMSDSVDERDVEAIYELYNKMLGNESNINVDANVDVINEGEIKRFKVDETARDIVIDCLLRLKEECSFVRVERLEMEVGIDGMVLRGVLEELDREDIIMYDGVTITFIN